jgi:SAM-dependent methyltransferase
MTDQEVDPFLWHTGVNPAKLRLLDSWAVGKRAVDVGCGNGAYAQHLREAGFSVTAIDAEDRIANKEGINFLFSTVPPIPLTDKGCDTLVLFDVLEHVAAEDKLLAEIRRVTTQRLILSVPSDNDGTLPLYGLCHVHHVDKTHQREYNPGSLKKVLSQHGFRIIHIQAQHPVNAPLVVKEFFKASPISRVLQRMTVKWIKFLRHRRIIQVNLPADWFVIADLISD